MSHAFFHKKRQYRAANSLDERKTWIKAGISIVFLAFLLLNTSQASAHTAGQSFEKTVGDYLVDIGYDALEVKEGQEIVLDMALIEKPGSLGWKYADYDSVWLQISMEGQEPFRSVSPVGLPSPVMAKHTFEKAGDYQLAVRFLKGEEVLADAAFTLDVKGANEESFLSKAFSYFLFIVFLAVVVGVIWVRRNAPKANPATHRTTTKRKK
jgi:hypothetical protein